MGWEGVGWEGEQRGWDGMGEAGWDGMGWVKRDGKGRLLAGVGRGGVG